MPKQTKEPSAIKKPNILFIMADDIGWFNSSCYNHGIMGYQDTEHRSHRQRRRDVYGFLWAAELHCRTCRLYYGPVADPYRPHEGWRRRARRSV